MFGNLLEVQAYVRDHQKELIRDADNARRAVETAGGLLAALFRRRNAARGRKGACTDQAPDCIGALNA